MGVNSISGIMNNTLSNEYSRTVQTKDGNKVELNAKNKSIEFNAEIDEQEVSKVVSKMNEETIPEEYKLEYEFHKETKTHVIKVIDSNTSEVIEQFPAQKLLDYAAGLIEHIGLIVDKKV